MKALYSTGAAAAALMVVAAGPAFAQSATAPSGNPQSDDAAVTIDEVVVTAERRENRLQSVALAISAVTGEAIDRAAVKNFSDLIQTTPGVSSVGTSPQGQKVVMRGVSAGTASDATNSATGFYLNDTPLAASTTGGGVDLDLYDIARVEVLRGPQGTLYGGGSMGGTVRVITNQPDSQAVSGSAEVIGSLTAGDAAGFTAHAALNVPLIPDRLAVRAVGSWRKDEGWIDDPVAGREGVNENRLEGGRIAVLWTPTDAFSATLTGIYQKSESDGRPAIDTTADGTPLYGDLTQHRNFLETSTNTTQIVNLVLQYDFEWARLSSSTSRIDVETVSYSDSTLSIGVYLPGAPLYAGGGRALDQGWVQELRLASTSDGPFSWVVGAYYQDRYQPVFRNDVILPPSPLASLPPLTLDTRFASQTYAAFGEATYDFTPQWSLTAGLRYTSVDTSWPQVLYGLLLGLPDISTAVVQSPTDSSSSLTPKVQLTYKPDDDRLFYIQAAQGFRPGGPNLNLPGIDPKTGLPVPTSYEDDSLWNYEIGAKTSFFDRRLTVNAAAYYIDWQGIQVIATTATLLPYIANAGGATSKGVELEVRARPNRNWSFGFAASWTDARFSEDSAIIGVKDGDRIPLVPELSGSVNVEYRTPLTDTMEGFAVLNTRYVEGSPMGYSGNALGVSTQSYAATDIVAGVTLNDRYELSLFAKNLFDERGEQYVATDDLPTRMRVTVIQPRTLGLRLSTSF